MQISIVCGENTALFVPTKTDTQTDRQYENISSAAHAGGGGGG